MCSCSYVARGSARERYLFEKSKAAKERNSQTLERKRAASPRTITSVSRAKRDQWLPIAEILQKLQNFEALKQAAARPPVGAKICKISGFGSTPPAWALAYGLFQRRARELQQIGFRQVGALARATSKQSAAGGTRETWRAPAESSEHPSPPRGRSHPAPPLLRECDRSGALTLPRAREVCESQRLRTSSNRRLLPPIPPRRAKSSRRARSCCMRRSQAGESSKIICSARADSM